MKPRSIVECDAHKNEDRTLVPLYLKDLQHVNIEMILTNIAIVLCFR